MIYDLIYFLAIIYLITGVIQATIVLIGIARKKEQLEEEFGIAIGPPTALSCLLIGLLAWPLIVYKILTED